MIKKFMKPWFYNHGKDHKSAVNPRGSPAWQGTANGAPWPSAGSRPHFGGQHGENPMELDVEHPLNVWFSMSVIMIHPSNIEMITWINMIWHWYN